MTANWGGAQWVLATIFVLITVMPPLIRQVWLRQGAKPARSTVEYWGDWAGMLMVRLGLVVMLYWGGFWS